MDSESDKSKLPSSRRSSIPDMRAHILQTAKRLFREKGYSAVSVNDIVTAAGITKPTLYHYFGDKENLFAEVLLEMMRHGRTLFEPQLKPSKGLRETLTVLAEGYLSFCPTSLVAMLYEAKNHLGELHLKSVMDAYHYYILSPFEMIFQKAMLERELRQDVEPREIVQAYLGALDALNLVNDSNRANRAEIRLMASRLVNTLLSGVKS